MLHSSEVWPVKKENEAMKMIRQVYDVKLKYVLFWVELRQWLGIEDVITAVLQ